MEASDRQIEQYTNLMDSKTKNIFGKNYLDTENNKSKHIRDMFKDWDRHIYAQEILNQTNANPGSKYLQEHVELYEKHLKNHVGKKFVIR